MFRFVELGFRIALEFEDLSSSVQAGSIILLRVASSFEFRRLLDIYGSLMRCHRLFGR